MDDKVIKAMTESMELFRKKNKDYGDSMHKFGKIMEILFPNFSLFSGTNNVKKYNIIGIFVQIIGKITRLSNLLTKNEKEINFESIKDTLIDISNYSLMLYSLLESKKLESKKCDTYTENSATKIPKENITIAIDFDGVISKYDGFKGKGVFGNPIKWAKECINRLYEKGYTIIIFTTRSEEKEIKEYLNRYDIKFNYINKNPKNYKIGCSDKKVLADIYLDDRAINFNGNWHIAYKEIIKFNPWWKI